MVIVRAPVRISFGGGGTDLAAYYTHFNGFVVSSAITRYCYVMAKATADGSTRISSADYHMWQSYPRGVIPPVAAPLSLPKAAIAWFMERDLLTEGIDLFLASEVPPGTGLGSSSAMAVALVYALAALAGSSMEPEKAAELACELEIERLAMPIGKQDQYASAMGELNTIEFTANAVHVSPLALAPEVSAALSARLMLFSTGQARNSAEILDKQRADTEKKVKTVEALHRIKALAIAMQKALVAGNLDHFGHLLDLGWQEKKQLSRKISSAAIDACYEAACRAGAIGGKIVGAGGGGFLLLYCPQSRQKAVRATLAHYGLREMTFDLDFTGAQVLMSPPRRDVIDRVSHDESGSYSAVFHDRCS
ncbi:MAG TPA: hypothetical protein VKY19_16290 [Ktedonosporobacter sp.]|jgi:D-glycero-alpha-D-manno-heptose-7-phosphate kinase|nr:hypothetical protein [Ktedonosporobacter sp.]